MNENKLKRALGSAKKSAEAIQDLDNLIMNLQLDNEELDRIIHVYIRLKTESDVIIEQLNSIVETHEPND